MDTSKLKRFAQFARRTLIGQVGAKLDSALPPDAAARREHPDAMKKLDAAIAHDGKGQVIERVAYTWFNRFSALRYMDVNDLNSFRVVSPVSGQFQPEILAEAKAGNIDGERVPEKIRAKVRALLDGRAPSPHAQAEAYRMLLVAICNDWHRVMPFLFERIEDYTELLLPDDLLSNASILAFVREAMTPDVCEDVEIIGWLYQFYISEKKDHVFAGLKKNQKITAENIPAATQLFTPHWIVRYLVENSLGRLWLLNRPGSKLAERMDYYIAPENPETDFAKIGKPEEIKICDPACGSGHMLTYAFELLHAFYEEEGYDPALIPALILKHNLTGVEIDDRAGALAAFALAMKAAAKLGRRQFVRMEVRPDIVVLQDVAFTAAEMTEVAAVVRRDLFTDELRETLHQFEQAKNFGSLIVPKLRDPTEALRIVKARNYGGDLLLKEVQDRVAAVLNMAEALSPKYHVVVANPPYMGGKGMNGRLKAWLEGEYPVSKSDLMTAFMERASSLCRKFGYWSMINLPSWMFTSSYAGFREAITDENQITSLLHLGRGVFGADFGAVAFSIKKSSDRNISGNFRGLFDNHNSVSSNSEISRRFFDERYRAFYVSSNDFRRIPQTPIAYWVTERVRDIFSNGLSVSTIADAKQGIATGENDRFLRFWYEVSATHICFDHHYNQRLGIERWYPYSKGGPARKWYGNLDLVVDWSSDGYDIKNFKDENGKLRSRPQNLNYQFKPAATWSLTSFSSLPLCARWRPPGCMFDINGMSAFSTTNVNERQIAVMLSSRPAGEFIKIINPTLAFQSGDVGSIPIPRVFPSEALILADRFIQHSKSDWDAYETSWDFTTLPLLSLDHRAETLEATYARLRAHWQGMTNEMKGLEEENNRIFIDAYGLQGELTPEVAIDEITLTCNPAYRYGGKATEAELEARLLSDTIAEFLHYAVGCMFGRYSLDMPGLILANQDQGVETYRAKVPNPTFEPDADNVIPVLDADWFADDVTDRFRRFLHVTFGEKHFQENLVFVEAALGKDIRRYFTRDFYNDHVKRYKKRPIYWLLSSPKGSFSALIYTHRYRPDTVNVVLNDYLREFRSKLEAHRRGQEALSISGKASPAQKAKALKEIETTARQTEELDTWERDVLFPLATQKIEIYLDDGVKANYPKFGAALKPIKGLNDSDD